MRTGAFAGSSALRYAGAITESLLTRAVLFDVVPGNKKAAFAAASSF
jgi:hypothetical protein